jgi:predicted nucleic acid-binding protein
MTRLALLDNTVLTNFAVVGRPDLVRHLWSSSVCTTESTLAEYQAGCASGLLSPEAWAGLPILTLTREETAFAINLPPKLGAGERTCLSIAFHRQGLLITDDLDARNVAQQYGVPITGTIGILVLCVKRGCVSPDQANALLAEMVASGYRSPVVSLNELL